MRRVIPTILLAAAILLVNGSCSTKKNTWSSRQYHNLTSRFNVNFNAKESFKDAQKKTEAIYPQTFDEILPVFAFTYPDAPSTTSADLDRVITKSNKLIATHSITAKPKRKASSSAEDRKFYNKHEFCDMVDDAYLYIGKSKMYMQQYEEASPIFQSIINNYPDQNTVLEAKVWLAIAAAERGATDEATEQLTLLENRLKKDKKIEVSRQVELALNSAWATIYIKKGQYSEAIPRLTNALTKAQLKATKVRYRFILAQLYERTGNNSMATAYYDKVSRMNVPYEVEFSALMSKANTMDNKSKGSELEKMYKKMLNDEKNAEYVDQLYYALGNLSKTQGDTTRAVTYYKQSVASSSGNDMQKGLSSLALGNSYYASHDYLPAFNAYDSASIWLVGHAQQKNAEAMANKLRRVGISLAVIEREDSLQRIAKQSPQERQKYAEAQVSKAIELQQQAAQAVPQYASYQYNMQQAGVNPTAGQGSNQWYFYNTMALNQGTNDFKMRWGQRKLEDNWRRKNKSMTTISDAEKADEILADDDIKDILTPDGSTDKTLTPTSAEYYLQNVPLTEESLQASNSRIEKALYTLATGYQMDIKDNALAQAAFKQLLERFPQSENRPVAYYSMYQLLTESGNSAEAEPYKSSLIAEFPKDKLALSLQNPNYVTELNKLEAEAEQKYEQALTLYRNGSNAEALSLATGAMVSYQGLPTEANFALLKTLATSYNGDVAGYKQDLQKVVKDYPASSAAIAAKNILATIEKEEVRLLSPDSKTPSSSAATTGTGVTPPTTTLPPSTVSRAEGQSENITADQAYSLQTDAQHYVLVVLNKDVQLNKLAFDIALYNADHFLNQNYELMEESSIDDSHKAIVIRTFGNKGEAMTYYNSVVNQSLLISSQPANSTICFAISVDNFERLKLKRSLAEYVSFFQQNYLP